jgi:hypothetical protein
MKRVLGAVALLFLLSIHADARRELAPWSQLAVLCGRCMELDNETLPDKHYFPPIDELGADQDLLPEPGTYASAEAASEHIWTPASPHSLPHSPTIATAGLTAGASANRHGEPSADPAAIDADWAYGGLRECDRGPEGKISAGCHATQYDNLLCNSHYDDCDNELFALALTAVQSNDAEGLRELLEHSDGSAVVLNRKRSAIQFVGCTGNIVGHLPISAGLLRATTAPPPPIHSR